MGSKKREASYSDVFLSPQEGEKPRLRRSKEERLSIPDQRPRLRTSSLIKYDLVGIKEVTTTQEKPDHTRRKKLSLVEKGGIAGDQKPGRSVDECLDAAGQFNRYQIYIFFLACFPAVLSGIQIGSTTFTGYEPDYRCRVHDCDIGEYPKYHPSADWIKQVIPIEDGDLSKCNTYKHNITKPATQDHEVCEAKRTSDQEKSCSEWVFDDSIFDSTSFTEFEFYCDDDYLKTLSTSLFMAGFLVGAPLFGQVSDRFGRKIALVSSALGSGVMGVCAGVMPEIISYLICTFLQGVFVIAVFQTAFLLAVEYVGTRVRMICGVSANFFFASGETLASLFGYAIRDFRILQICVCAPIFITIFNYWLLPESARWQLAKGDWKGARKFVEHAAKVNKKDVPEYLLPNEKLVAQKEDDGQPQISFFSAMKDIVILRMTLVMIFCWITSALAYFALSQNASNLGGSLFVNTALIMVVEIPGVFTVLLLLDRIGRRFSIIGYFLVSGVACIAAGFVPEDSTGATTALSLIGKMAISAAFAIVFMYTAEIFPTVIRNSCVGACSMFSRMGAIAAPFIADLGDDNNSLPFLICGVAALIAALLCLDLPETNGAKLPETLEDCKNLKKKSGGIFSITTRINE